MKVVKPDNLALLPRVLVEAETCVLSVAAMAFFSLEDPPSLGSESEMWECVTQILPEDEVLDSGLPKPRAEFLVYGHAFDQGGRGVAGVDVEVGTCRKRLHVFGERFWRDREYTRAEPFTKLPLDWEHAYGGPEFPPNPVGKGHIPMKGEFQNVHPLPNVVAADHTPGSSRDQVENPWACAPSPRPGLSADSMRAPMTRHGSTIAGPDAPWTMTRSMPAPHLLTSAFPDISKAMSRSRSRACTPHCRRCGEPCPVYAPGCS